jgi:uncharacterized protein
VKHLLDDFRIARSFRDRLVGLMWERDEQHLQLVIPDCSSIHTWFMRHPIDVAFIGRDDVVLAVHEAVGPWRFLFGPRGTVSVVEMPAGYTRSRSMKVGDEVTCQ